MLIGILSDMFEFARRYLRYQAEALRIARLDERLLADIGVSRGQLCAEAWDRTAAR